MFFKKKLFVEDYCTTNLTTLFSSEREITWEDLRCASNDSQLIAVEAQLYYNHLRAVFIQLMLIAITKNSSMEASSDAFFFVMAYLKERNLSEIYEISRDYNREFASGTDGVEQMVLYFADILADGKMKAETIEQLYVEFYAILRIFFDDFKNYKLVPSILEDQANKKVKSEFYEKLSPKEAAIMLNVNIRTIYRYIEKGILPKITINNKIFINVNEINNLISQGVVNKKIIDTNKLPEVILFSLIPNAWIGFIFVALLFYTIINNKPFGDYSNKVTLICVAGGWTYWLMCVYRYHAILQELSMNKYHISPIASVGYHFLPIYNIFWIFYWTLEMVNFIKTFRLIKIIPGSILGSLIFISLILSSFNLRIYGPLGLLCLFSVNYYIAETLNELIGAIAAKAN